MLTPHILPDGRHLTQAETALVLRKSGLSILGPLAVNTAAPDEGNIYLLGKVGSPDIQRRFLAPMIAGHAWSAFFMTEPAAESGAGSDPSMMRAQCRMDGNHWVINGRKAFITGADGAKVGIVMARSDAGACLFVVDLPDPAIRIARVPNTIESAMTKVAVSEASMRIADRCGQVMGGSGVTTDTMVEQVFREVRTFRIHDGPTEVHKWSLATNIERDGTSR